MGSGFGRRRGILLPSAVVIGFVILSLAGIYAFLMRTQDTRGRRFQGQLVTQALSEGAVHHVSHLVRIAADPGERLARGADDVGGFRELARQLPSRYPALLAGLRDGDDDRGLIDRLFGRGSSEALDQLRDENPGAELEVHLAFEVHELPSRPDWLADPVAKALEVRITARAGFGRTTSETTRSEWVAVYPMAPPLMGRFTGNSGLLWHDAEQALPDDPFDADLPDQPLVEEELSPDAMVEAFETRGWVAPSRVELRPGGGSAGDEHLLWKPRAGSLVEPTALPLELESEAFPVDVPAPAEPGVDQQLLLSALVRSNRALAEGALPRRWSGEVKAHVLDELDRGDLAGLPLRSSSPFGTTLHPSPTLAPGSYLDLFAATGLVVDRDATGEDEQEQRSSVGEDLPVREALAYLFSTIPTREGEYQEAVRRRLEGEAERRLPRVEEPGLPNRNLLHDRDQDGVPETPVPSEQDHPTVTVSPVDLDPAVRVPEYGDFLAFGSRPVVLPLQATFALASREVGVSQQQLVDWAYSAGGMTTPEAYRWSPRTIAHRDPVHARADEQGELVEGVPEERLYYRSRALEDPGLDPDEVFRSAVAGAAAQQENHWQPTVRVFGSEGLRRFFPDGDLQGHRVVVYPVRKDQPGFVKLSGADYRAGTLISDIVEVDEVVPEREIEDLLRVAGAQVFLATRAENHLSVVGGLRPVADQQDVEVRLRGTHWQESGQRFRSPLKNQQAFDQKVEQLEERYPMSAPLMTGWDERRDPVGVEAHRGYRVAWMGLR